VPTNPIHARIAAETLPLANRPAWRAISRALAETAPGPGVGKAALSVWAERKALRRRARQARPPTDPSLAMAIAGPTHATS
jgi:hypothetical protein